MNAIQLLDASLRDGGHRTNFHFSDDHLKAILTSLNNSDIEYIEIGYRNGSLHPIEGIGRAGLCDKNYLALCQSLIKKSNITVMAHARNMTQSDLLELKDHNVGLLRICIEKNKLAESYPIIDLAKKINLPISLNFIHMTNYTDAELDTIVEQANSLQPDIIYFADSNGSIFPDRVASIYKRYTQQYSIPFGFHAHDNIGLAQTNAIAAVNSGATFIDASLAGMGKGTGNLKTEFFIAFLKANKVQKYKLQEVLNAANYVRHALKIGQEEIEMDEFIRGIANYSTAELKLFNQHNK